MYICIVVTTADKKCKTFLDHPMYEVLVEFKPLNVLNTIQTGTAKCYKLSKTPSPRKKLVIFCLFLKFMVLRGPW